jgi:hypothetical protein
LKRKDIEQIIHNAYKYNDQEVINHLSKNQRIANVFDDFRNMRGGYGFQTKQMPSGYQFATSADFTSFMSGTGATVNTVAVESIINFWRNALNAVKIDGIEIPAIKDEIVAGTGTSTTPPTTTKVDYLYNFKPRGYVYLSDWNRIWTSLRPTDYNKLYALNVSTFRLTGNMNLRPNTSPSYATEIRSGTSNIEFKVDPFIIGDSILKIESGGSPSLGYIESLKLHLAAHPPMDNDDNHALLIKEIGTAMSAATTGFLGRAGAGNKYFESMLRQTSIGQDRVQGLASTWNYVVGLPELIQKRQGKAPGGVLEYKQKLILKSKGIELQKLLDKKFEYTDTTGQKQFVRLADVNKLSKDNFTTVMGLAAADLARVGDCVAFIQQELDKDNSPIRKFIKDTDAYSAVFRGKPNIKL